MELDIQKFRDDVNKFKEEQTDQGHFKNIDFLYDSIEMLLKQIEEKGD